MKSNLEDSLEILISLSRITFLSLAEKIKLYKNLDISSDLALMSLEDLEKFAGRPLRRVKWNGKENLEFAKREIQTLLSKDIGYLVYGEADYPALLKETVNAPFVLFYRGNKEALYSSSLSVVGSRRVTPEGRKATFDFAFQASLQGFNVVSGLATGVDSEAHRGAVTVLFDRYEKSGNFDAGKTIAVLPCGIDTVFPSANKKLAEQIIKTGGVLVSEYVPGTPAEKFRFVQRNRIIAALSPVTVVTEAPDGSGALITADYALDYNRELVFLSSCFSKSASLVRETERKKNAALLASGAASGVKSRKSLSSIEKYLEMGAPVAENFEDLKKILSQAPEERALRCKKEDELKNNQQTLF